MTDYAELARRRKEADAIYRKIRSLGLKAYTEFDAQQPAGFKVAVEGLKVLEPRSRRPSDADGAGQRGRAGRGPAEATPPPPARRPGRIGFLSMHLLSSVCVSRTSGEHNGLVVTLRHAYEGKLPVRKGQISLAKTMLGEVLAPLEEGDLADVGSSEDAVHRVRTDQMEA